MESTKARFTKAPNLPSSSAGRDYLKVDQPSVAHSTHYIHLTADLASRPLPTSRCQDIQHSEEKPFTDSAGRGILFSKIFNLVPLGMGTGAQLLKLHPHLIVS